MRKAFAIVILLFISITSMGAYYPIPLPGTSGNFMQSNGTKWQSSGLLGVGNGGTGLNVGTSGGILGYTSNGVLASSSALTANQLIIGGGAGATPSTLAAGSQYAPLVMGASAPGYAALDLSQSAARTGTLPVANGGTGLTTGTSGGVPYYSATGVLSSSGALTQYGIVLGGGAGVGPTMLAPDASTVKWLKSGGSSANPAWTAFTVPKVTKYTSGTAATHNVTGTPLYVIVMAKGGGGAGGSSGTASTSNGSDGNPSTVDGSGLTQIKGFGGGGGGGAGISYNGGAGGTYSGADFGYEGDRGGTSLGNTVGLGILNSYGPNGGGTGAGVGGTNGGGNGGGASASSGGGGGAGGGSATSYSAAGGGEGGTAIKYVTTGVTSFTYTVGAAVTGPTAGTGGGSGGNGAGGWIVFIEMYQ